MCSTSLCCACARQRAVLSLHLASATLSSHQLFMCKLMFGSQLRRVQVVNLLKIALVCAVYQKCVDYLSLHIKIQMNVDDKTQSNPKFPEHSASSCGLAWWKCLLTTD